MSYSGKRIPAGPSRFKGWLGLAWRDMSVLDDFAQIRLYRNRASEFELLAEAEPLPEACFATALSRAITGN